MIVAPPVPTNCAWFVLHEPDVRDVKAIGPSAVDPLGVQMVNVTVDVVRPLGVDVINNVQFDWFPDLPMLTPNTRGPGLGDWIRPDTMIYRTAARMTVTRTTATTTITMIKARLLPLGGGGG